MEHVLWQFEALDSLFFRDGRPHNAGETAWVESGFPPTGYTMQGAVRTAILIHLDADMGAFSRGEQCLPDGTSMKEELGDRDGLGVMRLMGPLLTLPPSRPLFPAPLDLVRGANGFALLKPDTPVKCDLGQVRLPVSSTRGLKTQEGKMLTGLALQALLTNRPERLAETDVWSLFPGDMSGHDDGPVGKAVRALADIEPKVGLARDNSRRTAKAGMLYSIAPVRPRQDVRIGVGVAGVARGRQPTGPLVLRLGGEGKLASVEIGGTFAWPEAPPLPSRGGRVTFRLLFITPALFPGGGWWPPGFAELQRNGNTVWEGIMDGVTVTIVASCIGKRIKIGGWDLSRQQPKDLTAFVPAGSVYFCEASSQDLEKVLQLHTAQLGHRTEYGFGQVLVGSWEG